MASTYDPARVLLSWGNINVSGYADGSMIQVSPTGDGAKAQTGTAGEAAFVKSYNQQFEVTFRLFETAHDVNQALMNAHEAGNAPAPLSLTHKPTGMNMTGDAILERKPGVTYDNNVPVREYKLIVLKLDQSVGDIG